MRSASGFRPMGMLAALAIVVSGCQVSHELTSPGLDEPQVASSEPATTVPLNEQVANGAGASASLADVYESVRSSVVYLESPDGMSSGTGIVIEGRWILTNAHVVDRFDTVVIGRSDGIDLGEHPVHATDWLFDLALVGPVDDPELAPLERASSSSLRVGDQVALIGFPDESSINPTPTLTEGIVSRRRHLALGDFPFIQVDATIAPGQSGGALVDGQGRLMGISGLEFGEGEFGLAFEADAMWPRIDALAEAAPDTLPNGEADFSFVEEVGPVQNFAFVIDVDGSGSIEVLATSDDDVFIELQTLGGLTVVDYDESGDAFEIGSEVEYYVDELLEGGEELIGDVEPGTYQVIIGSFADDVGLVEIVSTNRMRRFDDVEEGSVLAIDTIVEGEIDWPRDTDTWVLPLGEGEPVTITADGIADTVVSVRFNGGLVATSDDEGLGVFGTGSRVEFVAPADGQYEVEVGSFDSTRWGYMIEVQLG